MNSSSKSIWFLLPVSKRKNNSLTQYNTSIYSTRSNVPYLGDTHLGGEGGGSNISFARDTPRAEYFIIIQKCYFSKTLNLKFLLNALFISRDKGTVSPNTPSHLKGKNACHDRQRQSRHRRVPLVNLRSSSEVFVCSGRALFNQRKEGKGDIQKPRA